MRLGTILATLASHWRRRPLQAAAALAGLALATALWSGVQALNAEAGRSYDEAAAALGADRVDRLEPVAEGRLDRALYVALRRAGWDVSPVIEGRVTVGGRSLRLVGVEPLTLPGGAIGAALAEDGPGLGAFTAPPWAMLAAPETLDRLGISPGERGRTDDGRALPEPVAAARLAPDILVIDIGAAAELLGPALTALLVDPDAPEPETDWREIAGGALLLEPAGGESDIDRLTRSFHLNLAAFGFLAFCVGLFITHAAVGLAFEQRLGLMRTMRACGVSARELTAGLLIELLVAVLLAGAVGLALGYLLAGLLMPGVAATLAGLYGAPVSGGLRFEPSWWAAGFAMTLAGAFVAAGHTLARAFSMPVLASARRQAWRRGQMRALGIQAGIALAALAVAGGVAALGQGLVAGFVVMGGLLLGATLLLPGLLAALLAGAQRLVRGPLATWAVADARQQISGLSLALMALLLALATNIGVGTMVESFRTSFVDWLDKRLLAEVYVDPAAEEAAAVGAFLEGREGVAEILVTRRVEIALPGAEQRLDLVGRPADSAYRGGWPFLEETDDAWDRIGAGEGAMASEQLARRLGLALGDRVTLPAPSGDWEVEVVAIYADYGNPQGEIGVGLRALEDRWPGTRFDGYGVVLDDPARIDPLMADLAARFDLGPDRLIDNAGVKAFSLRVFERTFAVTAMLNVLTLAVAGVALFASLLTLSDLRLSALAPLWAVGVTRRRLAWMELAKTVALALATALAAIPFGLLLAWLLLAVINVEAFGWRLPLHLFPGQWAWLMALTLLVALAAAAAPALRLARIAPARLAKLFAEER